jgi:hypothetical protein
MNHPRTRPASLSQELPKGSVKAYAAEQRRPIIMVLGMHRSGTSLCSHVLSALGIDMADMVPGPGLERVSADNAKGHWERWEIVALHDRILHELNRVYLTPAHDLAFPPAWWADPRIAELRREIVDFLGRRMRQDTFGFKDPRTVRLMPVWQQIVNELKLAPKIIYCLRNPAQVARSLQHRDGLDPQIGEYRWFAYTVDFARYTKDYDFCVIEYESWFDDFSRNVGKLKDFLGVSWPQIDFDFESMISGIIDAQLRHDNPWCREPQLPLVRSLYKVARRADRDALARQEMQQIAAQFLSFQQLESGVQRGVEQILATGAHVPALQEQASTLRSDLEAATARARASEESFAAAVSETARQTEQIADLARDRDAAATAAQCALAELARQTEQIADLARNRDAAATAAQCALAELDATRQRLFALEIELAGLRGSLGRGACAAQKTSCAVQTGWTECAELRHKLARAEREAEREARERELAAGAAQTEVASLRNQLAASRECELMAAAMHAQVASLQDQLAASGRVGQHLLAALATDLVHVSDPVESLPWRRALFRRLSSGSHHLKRITSSTR